jgi:hypothetical protein
MAQGRCGQTNHKSRSITDLSNSPNILSPEAKKQKVVLL